MSDQKSRMQYQPKSPVSDTLVELMAEELISITNEDMRKRRFEVINDTHQLTNEQWAYLDDVTMYGRLPEMVKVSKQSNYIYAIMATIMFWIVGDAYLTISNWKAAKHHGDTFTERWQWVQKNSLKTNGPFGLGCWLGLLLFVYLYKREEATEVLIAEPIETTEDYVARKA